MDTVQSRQSSHKTKVVLATIFSLVLLLGILLVPVLMSSLQLSDRSFPRGTQSAKYHYDRGKDYEREGKYDLAIAEYSNAIIVEPGYIEAYYARAGLYITHENFTGALRDYDRILQLNPRDQYALASRGRTSMFMGDYPQALQDFGRAIAQDPLDLLAYCFRGLTYGHMENYEMAFRDFDSALKLGIRKNENPAVIYVTRAEVYIMQGERDKAQADLRQVLEVTNESGLIERATIMLDALGENQ